METGGCLIDTPTPVSFLVFWAEYFGNKFWLMFPFLKSL